MEICFQKVNRNTNTFSFCGELGFETLLENTPIAFEIPEVIGCFLFLSIED